jgi:broad specificity phosphatase PhoE
MGEILLVRHGQASWGAADYDVLSPLGERQGPVTGQSLRSVAPTLLVHGSLRRQRETAGFVAEAAGWSTVAQADARWDELDHRAIMEFAARPEGAEPSPAEFLDWFTRGMDRWHSGDFDADYEESWPTFRERVLAALDDVAAGLDGDQTAVVVTSGGPISVIVSTLMSGETSLYRSLIHGVVNCSITRVRSGSRGLRIASFNEQTHLTGEFLTYV